MMTMMTMMNVTFHTSKSILKENNCTVVGNENTIKGDNNLIFGNGNTVIGNKCSVNGHDNLIKGVGITAHGFNNTVVNPRLNYIFDNCDNNNTKTKENDWGSINNKQGFGFNGSGFTFDYSDCSNINTKTKENDWGSTNNNNNLQGLGHNASGFAFDFHNETETENIWGSTNNNSGFDFSDYMVDVIPTSTQDDPFAGYKNYLEDDKNLPTFGFDNHISKKKIVKEKKVDEKTDITNQQCIICRENKKNVLLKDCKHLCCCCECSKKIKKCPICRTCIKQTPIFGVFF